MTTDEFIALVDDGTPPAPQEDLEAFEGELGARLPGDYRRYLARCNGGCLHGNYSFEGPTPGGRRWPAWIHHVCGLREELHLSLRFNRACGLAPDAMFPRVLLWVMDDPGGNGICLGISGVHFGRVYYWIHDELPDPAEWDGTVEAAPNVIPLANSFTEFLAGIVPTP